MSRNDYVIGDVLREHLSLREHRWYSKNCVLPGHGWPYVIVYGVTVPNKYVSWCRLTRQEYEHVFKYPKSRGFPRTQMDFNLLAFRGHKVKYLPGLDELIFLVPQMTDSICDCPDLSCVTSIVWQDGFIRTIQQRKLLPWPGENYAHRKRYPLDYNLPCFPTGAL